MPVRQPVAHRTFVALDWVVMDDIAMPFQPIGGPRRGIANGARKTLACPLLLSGDRLGCHAPLQWAWWVFVCFLLTLLAPMARTTLDGSDNPGWFSWPGWLRHPWMIRFALDGSVSPGWLVEVLLTLQLLRR